VRKPVVAASVKAQSHGLIIHCHGGGFVAQSSASHQVRHTDTVTVDGLSELSH